MRGDKDHARKDRGQANSCDYEHSSTETRHGRGCRIHFFIQERLKPSVLIGRENQTEALLKLFGNYGRGLMLALLRDGRYFGLNHARSQSFVVDRIYRIIQDVQD